MSDDAFTLKMQLADVGWVITSQPDLEAAVNSLAAAMCLSSTTDIPFILSYDGEQLPKRLHDRIQSRAIGKL